MPLSVGLTHSTRPGLPLITVHTTANAALFVSFVVVSALLGLL
jgi:hypothetical protein